MEKEDIKDILAKIGTTVLTAEEEAKARRWLLQLNQDQPSGLLETQVHEASQAIWAKLEQARPRKSRVRSLWPAWAAAAVLLIASVASWWALNIQPSGIGNAIADIQPGGNRATLTLADGRTIDLSEAQTGIVVTEGITYPDGSSVLGERVNEGTGEQVHALTTPKGGTYQITLPDGSRAWLNAASTLRYPSRFDNRERVVFLEGEAFFAVSRQPAGAHQPFKVVTTGQTIEVLGTQFNISAYPDEDATKTTLVEGKVKVTTGTPAYTLSPGQQAATLGAATTVQEVDTEQYTAWREGNLVFDGASLPAIMRQIGRWYDIDVHYQGHVPDVEFGGSISRNRPLGEVLKALETTQGVRFSVEAVPGNPAERRITVMP